MWNSSLIGALFSLATRDSVLYLPIIIFRTYYQSLMSIFVSLQTLSFVHVVIETKQTSLINKASWLIINKDKKSQMYFIFCNQKIGLKKVFCFFPPWNNIFTVYYNLVWFEYINEWQNWNCKNDNFCKSKNAFKKSQIVRIPNSQLIVPLEDLDLFFSIFATRRI
jgi:hypothetical protein